jgi:ABC-type iron transport system FetAB permease component
MLLSKGLRYNCNALWGVIKNIFQLLLIGYYLGVGSAATRQTNLSNHNTYVAAGSQGYLQCN